MSWNSIRNSLGKPFYESENCLIYCTDCIEALSAIDGDVFDLTVTSPPYNIGKSYEEVIAVEDYLEWSHKWIKQVYAKTKASGSFWLNVGYLELPGQAKALPISYLIWEKAHPFYLIQEVVWNYGAGVAGRKFYSPRNEKLLWYVKDADNYTFNLDDVRDPNVKYPNQKKNGKLKCNPLGKNPSDVWQIPKVTSGKNRSSKERMPHPAQFPEKMIDRIIKASSNKQDVVLDPFVGSGTTAIVALANDRKFVGFEILPEYCELTKQRIETYLENQKQEILF